ncbi:3-hydroxyacyl-ACP dehydratase [Caldimicrobium thiodismutans]|jgi:3-hydroxyacyl-[acyl-carrier-protein] dehydratase|uniref:3-hydroxyacyl-[acyl-carrier-protein] dehydratase FabZ n=1 Tax=Caldimicrobium thiodismutans TaxID=1653476 RepID=A0A0U4W485_9BACT|nr:3-hydroxyacyl-ACP dehydratase FabZ [Caldimicrobium thiodismutans]BAU23901.1 3-hydroxyacyl-ACP dehydratase [Caldimicrobium thiodismutans]
MGDKGEITAKEILELLPHRYPFLMVDKVLEIDPEREYIKAVKNVSHNEPFFQGHFPGNPIMPGVLILEAMAQTGAIYLKKTFPECKEKLFVLAGIENVRFKSPVLPGDTLVIEAEKFKRKGHIIRTNVTAKVEEKIVAQAEIIAAMIEVKDE